MSTDATISGPGELSEELDRSLSHHAPGPSQIERIAALRIAAKAYGAAIECNLGALADRHARIVAVERLEESLMWAVKSIILEPSCSGG